MDIVLLIIGFVLLVKGADFFVSGASDIARKLKVTVDHLKTVNNIENPDKIKAGMVLRY